MGPVEREGVKKVNFVLAFILWLLIFAALFGTGKSKKWPVWGQILGGLFMGLLFVVCLAIAEFGLDVLDIFEKLLRSLAK